MRAFPFLLIMLLFAACGRIENVGQAPTLSPIDQGAEAAAMAYTPFPQGPAHTRQSDRASLWSGGQTSLLGDRRASKQGDILTVVIEINDKAEFFNSSERARTGREKVDVGAFLGLPESFAANNANGATLSPAISTNSSSNSTGEGTIRRNEKLTLRIAATVVGALPNGVLKIQGSQEVRVNYELRELLVSGFVRPEDISRQNSIPYDKIASARISYGGRGQVSDVQQPRYGQQVLDIFLPL